MIRAILLFFGNKHYPLCHFFEFHNIIQSEFSVLCGITAFFTLTMNYPNLLCFYFIAIFMTAVVLLVLKKFLDRGIISTSKGISIHLHSSLLNTTHTHYISSLVDVFFQFLLSVPIGSVIYPCIFIYLFLNFQFIHSS